jgi:hypothetical protein
VKIGIDVSKKRGVRKNGIGIKIIGIACSLFTIGNEVSNYQLLKIVSSVTVTIGTTGQIRDSSQMIDILIGGSEEEHQFTIGWGAGFTCMNG